MDIDVFLGKIEVLGIKAGFLNKANFNGLANLISDREEVLGASECMGKMGGGAVIVTNKAFYASVFNKMLGADQYSIPLGKIGSYSTSGLGGLKLVITEGTTQHVFNTVSKSQDIMIAIKKGIEGQNQENTVPIQASSAADEIRKYKTLMDDGIITEEQFEKKKAELLG